MFLAGFSPPTIESIPALAGLVQYNQTRGDDGRTQEENFADEA